MDANDAYLIRQILAEIAMKMPTRRERIAESALKGLLAAGIQSYSAGPISVASEAIEHADALIAELDKELEG